MVIFGYDPSMELAYRVDINQRVKILSGQVLKGYLASISCAIRPSYWFKAVCSNSVVLAQHGYLWELFHTVLRYASLLWYSHCAMKKTAFHQQMLSATIFSVGFRTFRYRCGIRAIYFFLLFLS